MNSNWDTFQEKYRAAPPHIQNIIDSDVILLFVRKIKSACDLPVLKTDDLIILVSDCVLGIQKPEELFNSEIFAAVSAEKRGKVIDMINDFVKNPPSVPTSAADPVEIAPVAALDQDSANVTQSEPPKTPSPGPTQLPQRYMKPLTEMPRYDDKGRR
ncbi:hypothetical protein GW943_02810 [Candidatus Parcubacteria bacterium]|uniref:Uncharacterized protein n=1 Tax=Candidatus Kaiserbacteria bacterium CG10_big_fil_rev_8_21_14_0_10_47_16 TaxID=1974608 RepID=A0A2H0UDZ8_9BACT|nr:hypothetical protein [Candidatus Parcubacteria bacterium]PIR84607.1 MAG: hypothetical protein COU16_03475 [Candidatus Kaiserbacteria bacterium CG10_big_fil_rev_8_21_14_0_10_47_16]